MLHLQSLAILAISLVSYVPHAYAHAAIAPMLGVTGTPARSDVQRPQANSAPCGTVNIAQTLDTSTPVQLAANGTVSMTVTDFNAGADGSREIKTALVDTTGTGKSFNVQATMVQNGDGTPTTVGSEQLIASVPAGTQCTGGASGNLCLISMTTTAGFGNCVVVSQGASNGTASTASTTSANSTSASTGSTATGANAAAGAGTGATGAKGTKAAKAAAKAAKAAKAAAGATGATGATGAAGATGATGAAGATGATGDAAGAGTGATGNSTTGTAAGADAAGAGTTGATAGTSTTGTAAGADAAGAGAGTTGATAGTSTTGTEAGSALKNIAGSRAPRAFKDGIEGRNTREMKRSSWMWA